MWYIEDHFRVKLGGNIYIDTPNLIAYNGTPLFIMKRRESDGQLGISFDILDNNGNKDALVRENRIMHGDEGKYEIIREMDRFALIEKASKRIIFDIRKRTKAAPIELWVAVKLFMPDGFLIDLSPTETNLKSMGITISNSTFRNLPVGINIRKGGIVALDR